MSTRTKKKYYFYMTVARFLELTGLIMLIVVSSADVRTSSLDIILGLMGVSGSIIYAGVCLESHLKRWKRQHMNRHSEIRATRKSVHKRKAAR